MRPVLLFSIVMIFNSSISAQSNIEWKKLFGGSVNDQANDIKITPDGGTIIAGYATSANGDVTNHHGSAGSSDFWIVKTSATGNLLWQKSLGGNKDDFAQSVQLTADGGYLVAGYTNSQDGDVTDKHGGNDFWVVKLNSSGTLQKQIALGGSKNDFAYDVKPTADGGFVAAGASYSSDIQVTGHHGKNNKSDYWVVKVNAAGEIEWENSFGGKEQDEAHSIEVTPDGGYIVAGFANSANGDVTDHHSDDNEYDNESDYWVVKLNSAGNIQWTKSLGGSQDDDAYSIINTADGNYLVGGTAQSSDGDVTGAAVNLFASNYWLIKLDPSGNIIWQHSYGGSDTDNAYSVANSNDGGYLVAGASLSANVDVIKHFGLTGTYTGKSDYWVVKTDVNGSIIAQQTLGGTSTDEARAIQATPEGGCLVAGRSFSMDGDVQSNNSYSQYWIVKMKFLFYADQDHDGFGDAADYVVNTLPPPGYVSNDLDCNDQDDAFSPAETDVADGVDNNCDNSIDEFYINWQSSLGGTGDDAGYSISNTADGGSFVAGYSISIDGDVTGHHGGTDRKDFWITRLDSSGNLQWQKSLGGTMDDVAYAVQATPDGGCIATGNTGSEDGDVTVNHGGPFDVWVVKLDVAGNLQWQKSLGGTKDDFGYSIELTPDAGYIVGSYTRSKDGDLTNHHGSTDIYDVWVVKLDASGNLQWQESLGGPSNELFPSIGITADGGYVVGASTWSKNGDLTSNNGQSDYWIVKLDAAGTIQWQHSYGGSSYDNLNRVRQTSDGGYIVTGDTQSPDGDVTGFHDSFGTYDGWVVKLDAAGTMEWNKSVGGFNFDYTTDIIQLDDGGYRVCGSSASLDGDVTVHYGISGNNYYLDYWVLQLDASGNIEWQKTYGGSYNDHPGSMVATTDGGILVAGLSASADIDVTGHHGEVQTDDFWIVKLNATTGAQSITCNISSTALCPGQTFNVNYTTMGIFNAGNIFTVQLSDANGSFSSPVIIGSVASTVSGNISCQIPPLTTSGTGYRIRVVSSNPSVIGVDNGSDITITCPPPSSLTSSNITSSKATLAWNVVSCSQGYQIRYRKLGTTAWTMVNVSGNSKTITGLSPSTTYQWSVKTLCYTSPKITSSFAPNAFFTTAPLRLENENESNVLSVYPNPFNNYTHLDLSKLNWSDQVEIRITDLSGKILFEKTFTYRDKIEIGTELPCGFYLVEVKGNNCHHVIPIVKSN